MIPAPDLLVIGGLSIDRLSDGMRRPGGAVYHAVAAARAGGVSVASIVLAGPEPDTVAALGELHAAGPCRLHDAARSIAFAIDERGPRRRVVLEQRGGTLILEPGEAASFGARAVLFAPVAAELLSRSLAEPADAVLVAGLQGWLRVLHAGRPVRPRVLSRLPAPLVAALARLDALVASVDDVDGAGGRPLVALAALRRTFGSQPLIFVTAGTAGAWLDLHGTARLHLAPPRIVAGVSSIGAGDAFAAILAAGLGGGMLPEVAGQRAADAVADVLEARRA